MTATETLKPMQEKMETPAEKKKRLLDLAERDSLRRDFEIVRERHGLPKKQSPK